MKSNAPTASPPGTRRARPTEKTRLTVPPIQSLSPAGEPRGSLPPAGHLRKTPVAQAVGRELLEPRPRSSPFEFQVVPQPTPESVDDLGVTCVPSKGTFGSLRAWLRRRISGTS